MEVFVGKYVVGRQIFVDRHLVDRLLSKNFRRHDTSSTSILSTQHFVDTTFRRQTFRRQTFRRHDTSSKFFCRHKHAEVEELLRVLNFFNFQTIQLLNLGSEGEGDNYKTTSDKVRVKAKIFKLDHTKWGWGRKSGARINDFYTTKIFCRRNALSTKCPVDKMSCRRNVLSTKCLSTKICRRNILSTKCSVDEMLVDESLSTKCFDKNFVDEMLFDKSVIRRKT